MKQFLPIQAKTNKSISNVTSGRRKSQHIQDQSKQRENIPEIPTRLGYSLSHIPILPQADAARSVDSGHPLPKSVRQKMETAFGQDFADVRIHEGSHVTSIGALAYTQGTDLHFAPGRYQPSSLEGQALIGHELTHVAQQRAGRVKPIQLNEIPLNAESSLEGEADVAGKEAVQGKTVDVGGTDAHSQHAQSQAPIQMKPESQEEEEQRLPHLPTAYPNMATNNGTQVVSVNEIPALNMGSTVPFTAGDEAGSIGGIGDLRGISRPPRLETLGHEAAHILRQRRRLEL